MQGFTESTVLMPDAGGLGYSKEVAVVAKVSPAASAEASLLDDLPSMRAEKRRRELAAESGGSDAFGEDLGAAAEAAARNPQGRVSLREQLRINKEAKDEEWKEKHNPFKAPAALTEDEFNAHLELEEARQSKHAQQREQEKADFEQYAAALRHQQEAAAAHDTADAPQRVALKELEALAPALAFSSDLATPASAAALLDSSSTSPLLGAAAAPAAASSALPPLVLKRKHSGHDKESKHKKKTKHKDVPAPSVAAAAAPAAASAAPTAAPVEEPATLAGLAAYSSDDE